MRSKCSPPGGRIALSLNGRVDVSGISLRDRRQLFTVGRIQRVEILARRRLSPRITDEKAEPALVALEPSNGFFRILRGRAVLHGGEFFGDAHSVWSPDMNTYAIGCRYSA